MDFEPGLAVRTRVRPDRVDEFERWVQDLLAHMTDRVPNAPRIQLFREWPANDDGDASVEYMLFGAGTDLAALDLEPVLRHIHGPEQAPEELSRFEGMLDGEQDAWRLQRVEV